MLLLLQLYAGHVTFVMVMSLSRLNDAMSYTGRGYGGSTKHARSMAEVPRPENGCFLSQDFGRLE